MREERLVRWYAVEHARDEQRGMEPAAMLVGSFEIEVRREARIVAVRAAHDGEVRRAGIEPDVERVAALLVLRRLGAEQLLRRDALPGLDAVLLHALRDMLEQVLRARMQRARFAMQEERHRHTPLPLTRERPVGAVGDHAVQARLAPRREEFGALDAAQRGAAQRFPGDRLV